MYLWQLIFGRTNRFFSLAPFWGYIHTLFYHFLLCSWGRDKQQTGGTIACTLYNYLYYIRNRCSEMVGLGAFIRVYSDDGFSVAESTVKIRKDFRYGFDKSRGGFRRVYALFLSLSCPNASRSDMSFLFFSAAWMWNLWRNKVLHRSSMWTMPWSSYSNEWDMDCNRFLSKKHRLNIPLGPSCHNKQSTTRDWAEGSSWVLDRDSFSCIMA